MIKIILPFPPSSNTAYPTVNNRRIKSKELKEWIVRAENIFGWRHDTPIEKCTVSYLMFFPDDRIRDGQSYMKVPLDFLVSQEVFKDDNRKIVKGEQWIDGGIDRKNPRIEITIKEIK